RTALFRLAVEPLQFFFARAVERLGVVREAPLADVAEEVCERLLQICGRVSVLADELRRVAVVEAEDVVIDEDLAIAPRAGADADRRNREPLGDERREFRGNAFEDERATAGVLERERLVDQPPRVVSLFP